MPPRHSINAVSRPDELWKKKLAKTLVEWDIVSEKFIGKTVLYFQNGALVCIEKSETMK